MTPRTLIVERVSRRTPPPQTSPLPEPVRTALGSIADDLRHAPREVFVDRAELVHWLARMARRVDGVGAMTTAVVRDPRTAPRSLHADLRRSVSPREVAEAVFGKRLPASRTITTRKGRSVRVETRRTRDARQMDLWS